MAPKPKEPAGPLRPLVLAGFILLLPLALLFLAVGILGIQILLDADNSGPLSRSAFGQAYKRLIAMNPFFSAFFLNGGMIGALFAATKLWEHRAAVRKAKAPAAKKGAPAVASSEAEAAAGAAVAAGKPETKKEK